MEIGYIITLIFALIWLFLHIYEMIKTKGGEFKNCENVEIIEESENINEQE